MYKVKHTLSIMLHFLFNFLLFSFRILFLRSNHVTLSTSKYLPFLIALMVFSLILVVLFFFLKTYLNRVPVAHACNLSYSGGRDQEDCGSKSSRANT
jgi:hypothetical protein